MRTPLVESTSFKAIGIPRRGLSSPEARRSSAFLACSRANSGVNVMKACTSDSTASIRSRTERVSSTEEIWRVFSNS